ncbi:C2H2 type zinc finger-containing protein [Pseudomassariella vexata]|uniref:C2H2 type zinc finger-containing protein n=1 Tax=Pseudomassariella vexata TaxID=1141098 RepID=A0A1Y2DPQ9_9PEZI|nr:C2H2 type zinc finger-containing protein [Pseudomassariella vexata]ORY61268.1 C2H2 type zinc finger-containing protein [Pseudomassariella vexata]
MATIVGNRTTAASLAAKPGTAPSSHQYTCNTCQVAFRFADTQKGHMKSDWHRYNLKRRVASLPPISSEVFTEKVVQARAATTAEADKAGFQQICNVCQRTYFSENSYQNHIGSQKHKAKEAAMQRRGPASVPDDEASSVMSSTFSLGDPLPSEKGEVDSDAEDEFSDVVEGLKKTNLSDRPVERSSPVKRPTNPQPSAEGQYKPDQTVSEASSEAVSTSTTPVAVVTLKSCLFCNYESPTVPLSVVHMERIHGMFIPEKQYLVNLDGLIGALQQRIQELYECLYCGKMKNNAFAVQTHMRDKGHCKIPYTTEYEQLEIGEFYDFRSTYSDDESDDEEDGGENQNGGVKLGARRVATTVGDAGDEFTGEEEGWETDSSASSCDSDDLTSIPVDQHYHQYERLDKHPHHTSHDPRHHHQLDGWHSHAHKHRAIFYDDTQLHLPSGRAVGHRSLNKYYRQNLHSHPSPEERAERLAIAAGSSPDAMEVDGDGNQVAEHEGRGRTRAIVSRPDGLQGVTDEKKKEVRRAAQRARKVENNAQKRNQWKVNKEHNHQKYYNYQIL